MVPKSIQRLALVLLAAFLVFTSWLWVPLLVLTSPIWLTVGFIGYYFFATVRRTLRVVGNLLAGLVLVGVDFTSKRLRCLRKTLSDSQELNLGFALDSPSGFNIRLDPEDDRFRYSLQLYHFLATGLKQLSNLRGFHVVELGCKQGFGLSFLLRSLKPASVLGLTENGRQARRLNQVFAAVGNMRFHGSGSKGLPVKAESTDAVISVEAAGNAGQLGMWVVESFRMLKPGGHFFYASLMKGNEEVERVFEQAGFVTLTQTIAQRTDISHNVLRAIDLSKHSQGSGGFFLGRWAKRLGRCVVRSYELDVAARLEKGDLVYVALHAVKPISKPN